MRGFFVTGTGTGVGKTVLAAAVAAALTRAGAGPVVAHKPVLTGAAEAPGPDWPPDDELLAAVTSAQPGEVAPLRFGPAVSPHLAAELAGTTIVPAEVVRRARAAGARARVLVCEGAGGILVPIAPGFCMRDLARELDLPLLIAAPPGLGTINHTLLTVEAARAAGLAVAAVVLTPWRRPATVVERSNRDTIAAAGKVEVATLPALPRGDADLLARAGAGLPLARWLERAGADRAAA